MRLSGIVASTTVKVSAAAVSEHVFSQVKALRLFLATQAPRRRCRPNSLGTFSRVPVEIVARALLLDHRQTLQNANESVCDLSSFQQMPGVRFRLFVCKVFQPSAPVHWLAFSVVVVGLRLLVFALMRPLWIAQAIYQTLAQVFLRYSFASVPSSAILVSNDIAHHKLKITF